MVSRHYSCYRLLVALAMFVGMSTAFAFAANDDVNENSTLALPLSTFTPGMIGQHAQFIQESTDSRLSLQQVIQTARSGEMRNVDADTLTLGLNVAPVWMRVLVDNESSIQSPHRLSIETPWLDHIDLYILRGETVTRHVIGGDAIPFDSRPMAYRFFAVDHVFESGLTELYIRIETLGPMAIPLRLASAQQAVNRDIRQGYEYGILYGLMLALAVYNLILYVMIRQAEFGLYAGYLIGFVANSLSYTGQIHAVFTPHYGPYFQDWVDISLMVTYSVLGLHFARTLLKTKSYAPRLDRITVWIANGIPLGMLLGAVFNQLLFSMTLAFILNTSFAVLFIVLGYKAVKAKVALASFFFVSSVMAASCIGISTAAVAGLLPYNDVTFKLIEVGMAVEALLLAVVLGHRFRLVQQGKALAEQYAITDHLTALNNRRGFWLQAKALSDTRGAVNLPMSVMLLDIDKFKMINDDFGHDVGDAVLKQVSLVLGRSIRKTDIFARWGGEEFILLMPNTNAQEAIHYAERLREAVYSDNFPEIHEALKLTISIGVSHAPIKPQTHGITAIETLIAHADEALYSAKRTGRNKVVAWQSTTDQTAE